MIGFMMTPEQLPDWFIDLIDIRVTSGLDDDQRQRFDQFVSQHDDPDGVMRIVDQYELTAAALDLQFESRVANPENSDGSTELSQGMPERLRGKLVQDAKRFFEAQAQGQADVGDRKRSASSSVNISGDLVSDESYPAEMPAVSRSSPGAGLSGREVAGWLVAAASIAVLLTGWNPFAFPVGPDQQVAANVSVAQQLEGFVASAPDDLTRVDWQATDPSSKASGEVVWSDSQQTGYMVFNNLPLNDAKESQYQLWIFDTDAGQAHPVDGGTFNVTNLEKSVVKIDARVPVGRAVMFAVTEELPGGVVVSSRERLPLLAKVDR